MPSEGIQDVLTGWDPKVRIDLRDALVREWLRLGQPGTWWTGAERLAIAQEARAALTCPVCAARKQELSSSAIGEHSERNGVHQSAVDAVHRIVTDSGRLTESWLRCLLASGVDDVQYVELVGVTATVVMMDTFSTALGHPRPDLPRAEPGEPSHVRPTGARVHSAWLPTVVPEESEGELADFYSCMAMSPFVPGRPDIVGFVPLIARALTLVPAEQLGFARFMLAGYVAVYHLSPAQREFLAMTVSSFNQCFYCAGAHTEFLRASDPEADLKAVLSLLEDAETGIPQDHELRGLALTVLQRDSHRVDRARRLLQGRLGPEALVDAAALIGLFNAVNRVANATGTIEIDPEYSGSVELVRVLESDDASP